ncbi:MAG TPA: hypothetical protein VII63_01450 [Caulobacteraceae bacterium]
MSDAPPPKPPHTRGRFWLNVGEAAAVLAVVVAALSYWDAHRGHNEAAKQAESEAKARTAMVLKGSADSGGRRLELEPVRSSQVIQSQRYIFPSDVLGHTMEVSAAAPQIDVAWIAEGLGRSLERRHVKGDGEARLPVAIITSFIEDGEGRTDRSTYEIGYAYRSRFLLGREISLQGVSLIQRGVAGDLRTWVNRRWLLQSSGGGPR